MTPWASGADDFRARPGPIQVPRLLPAIGRHLLEDLHDIVSGQSLADLDRQALTAVVIN